MNDWFVRPGPLSPAWAADTLGVVSLGLLVWPVQGVRVAVLLAWAVLTLAATLGIRWRSRGRAARRRTAALEAYADREIARVSRKAATRDWPPPPARPASPPGDGRTKSGLTTMRYSVNSKGRPKADRDTVAESLLAELTSVAYTVVLLRGLDGSWLGLELGLWRALAETIEEWSQGSPPAGSPDEVTGWREAFLRELTASAFWVALAQGVKGPPAETELCLRQALRPVIQRAGRAGP